MGFSYLLFLTIPGFAVFTWQLVLISKRAERRQMGVELVGSGVLALSAPAAYWVGVGFADPTGWLLFGLSWLQSAASIVYAYLRLDQRGISRMLTVRERFKLGFRAVLYSSFNLLLVIFLSADHLTPPWLFVPYLVQWVETLRGVIEPAYQLKPTTIGMRQLIISTLFTFLFILAWRIS